MVLTVHGGTRLHLYLFLSGCITSMRPLKAVAGQQGGCVLISSFKSIACGDLIPQQVYCTPADVVIVDE
jgi:hypothetical protein